MAEKTTLQLIDELVWFDLINKLKVLFKRLLSTTKGYTVYTALLNQTGLADPIATIIDSDLPSSVVLTRTDTGISRLTSPAFADKNKVHVTLKSVLNLYPQDIPAAEFCFFTVFDGYIEIQTTSFDWNNVPQYWINLDDRLTNTPIEIKVKK